MLGSKQRVGGRLGVELARGGVGSGRGGVACCRRVLAGTGAPRGVARASFVYRSSGGAPRFRSERPSSIARVSPPRCAVAESSRGFRPTRRQPTRLPPTRRAHRARQRCGWRRSRAPGASPDCCGYAAAAVAPRRCARAASAAPAPLHGQSEQQFARASPRRADHQTVVRACSGATASDCCSFDGGQPRVEWRRPLRRQLA